MKYVILSAFFTFSCLLSAQDHVGIQFNHENWTETLAQAKEQDKMIFVDAYTTWCGPCKWLSKNVFPQEKVGSFYNDNFINLKLDMEKGEGLAVAELFKVTGYPTLLFLDSDGNLVHRSMGSRDVDMMVELGEIAIDPERQIIALKKRYNSGDRTANFLRSYVDGMTSAGMPNYEEVTKSYLDLQDDWNSEENIKFLFDYSEANIESSLFQHMISNKEKFSAVVGEDKVIQKITFAANRSLRSKKIDASDVDGLEKHFEAYFPGEGYDFAMQYSLSRMMNSDLDISQEKYKSDIVKYLKGNPNVSWQFLNQHAWHAFENSDDEAFLRSASEWITSSVEKDDNFFNNDTMASILFKLKDKDRAIECAKKAIAIANETGADASATEELLVKIMAL